MKFVDLAKYGPVHRFSDHHVYRTLILLSDGKRRGRKQVADSINIGEGSMRTIVEYLRDKGYIEIRQTGISISPSGVEFLQTMPIRLARLQPSDLSIAARSAAVLVKDHAQKITLGIEQRDAAMKAGADGATTVIVRDGWLIVPPDYRLDQEKPEIARGLKRLFSPSEGDVIIVGTAQEYEKAEDGALAAAFALL